MALFDGIFAKAPGAPLPDATVALGQNWGWVLAAGISYLPLGLVALMIPVASTLGLTFALAAILVAGGIVHLVQAVKLRHEQGGFMRFLQAILALAVGAFVFWYPGIGMLGITLSLSFYFLLGAVIQWIFASAVARGGPRGWVYLGAGISFVLGVYILLTLPISALWVPGTLLGLEFIFSGVGLIGLALAARTHYRKSHGIETGTPTGMHPSGQTT